MKYKQSATVKTKLDNRFKDLLQYDSNKNSE